MTPSATACTRLIALLGDPVGHSLSPVFQNAAFAAARVDGVYLALKCSPDELPGLLVGIACAGGGGNVTVPHKELAAGVVQERTEAVVRTGACNTFWHDGERLWGDNTDVAGFVAAMRDLTGAGAGGARVLMVGAGGAARAVLAALEDEGAGEVVILNRTAERSAALASRFGGAGLRVSTPASLASLSGERFDLVVNATSLGLRATDPLPLPLPTARGVTFGAALDLVYSPGETRWVRELRAQGIRSADGIEMLLHQGAAAFQRWWGREAPLAPMRVALLAARGP